MAPRILIVDQVRDLVSPTLLAGFEVTWQPVDEPLPTGDYQGVADIPLRRYGAAEFDRLPDLRVLANCAAGYDNVDLAEATRRGVVVTNTPDVLTETVADHTWALILAAARNVGAHERAVREGRWKRFHFADFFGLDLRGATLSLVGAGRIGQAVGRRARAFGMDVAYVSPSAKPAFEATTGARRVSLDDALRRGDVVSLHVPSTPGTRDLMTAARFALVKPGAVFVNTSRGDLVDEDALAQALETGRLRAAALDVFRGEPRLGDRLAGAPNLVVTPHMASATHGTRAAMADLALTNLRAVLLEGRAATTPVPAAPAALPDA